MPSLSAYHLTWFSLTLDVGYLFTAAPAKHSILNTPETKHLSRGWEGPWTPVLWKPVFQMMGLLEADSTVRE